VSSIGLPSISNDCSGRTIEPWLALHHMNKYEDKKEKILGINHVIDLIFTDTTIKIEYRFMVNNGTHEYPHTD
jgi:hypothetical protein